MKPKFYFTYERNGETLEAEFEDKAGVQNMLDGLLSDDTFRPIRIVHGRELKIKAVEKVTKFTIDGEEAE